MCMNWPRRRFLPVFHVMQLEQRAINYPVYVAVRYGGAQANRQARSLPLASCWHVPEGEKPPHKDVVICDWFYSSSFLAPGPSAGCLSPAEVESPKGPAKNHAKYEQNRGTGNLFRCVPKSSVHTRKRAGRSCCDEHVHHVVCSTGKNPVQVFSIRVQLKPLAKITWEDNRFEEGNTTEKHQKGLCHRSWLLDAHSSAYSALFFKEPPLEELSHSQQASPIFPATAPSSHIPSCDTSACVQRDVCHQNHTAVEASLALPQAAHFLSAATCNAAVRVALGACNPATLVSTWQTSSHPLEAEAEQAFSNFTHAWGFWYSLCPVLTEHSKQAKHHAVTRSQKAKKTQMNIVIVPSELQGIDISQLSKMRYSTVPFPVRERNEKGLGSLAIQAIQLHQEQAQVPAQMSPVQQQEPIISSYATTNISGPQHSCKQLSAWEDLRTGSEFSFYVAGERKRSQGEHRPLRFPTCTVGTDNLNLCQHYCIPSSKAMHWAGGISCLHQLPQMATKVFTELQQIVFSRLESACAPVQHFASDPCEEELAHDSRACSSEHLTACCSASVLPAFLMLLSQLLTLLRKAWWLSPVPCQQLQHGCHLHYTLVPPGVAWGNRQPPSAHLFARPHHLKIFAAAVFVKGHVDVYERC
ncbi:hypothetical protein Anapl_12369 [Anas platyrhynchos]|uniref:Uncharacterized protein n=1 Tax=Anas platyrhynchos TaxID=8839 RepID=R0L3G3_ANAPL|nr:hypothetical protein Anapl_12369 [Anas platyrhynchos]